MKQIYSGFLMLFLSLQVSMYGQDHTHVYSKTIGGNAWGGATNDMTGFTACQTSASVSINGFNWAGWPVTYKLMVNGNDVASGLSGAYVYDLTSYLPVNGISLVATSGSGWIELSATLSITSPTGSMPGSPIVSDVNVPTYGATSAALSASLTGNATTLKWYTSQTGDVASFIAPTPDTTVSGTTTYWVSEADASGCEGIRVPLRVNVPAAVNIAHISDSQCGSVLASASSYLYANLVADAQAYRFRVTDLMTGQIVEKDCLLRSLMLSTLPIFRYGAQYNVEVAVKRNGSWSGFGLPCTVNTPMALTQVGAQCGTTLARKSDYVYAQLVPYAKGYQFLVRNWNTGSVQFIDSLTRGFSFSSVSDYAPNTPYSIQVSVRNTDGNYLPFGPECMVMTAPGSNNSQTLYKMADGDKTPGFSVAAFPNPFTDSFSIDVQGGGNAEISVKVYDMLGRMVAEKHFEAGQKEMPLGESITAAGVYNVVVSQDGQTQTLRVIRR